MDQGDARARLRAWVLAIALAAGAARAQVRSLTAGPAELRLEPRSDGSSGIALYLDGTAAFRQDAPLVMQLDAASGTSYLQGRYAAVTPSGDSLVATGAIVSPNGSRFAFRDVYSAGTGAFRFDRRVTVSNASASDHGFATRFSLPLAAPASFSQCGIFIPGIRYGDTTDMPAGALASVNQDDNMFIREDRLPLPLVAVRVNATGIALSLQHRDPDGRTIAGDNTNKTLIDARLRYASLGVHDRTRTSAGMWYPGFEGDRGYYGGWTFRRHPVAASIDHAYSACIRVWRSASFAEAAGAAWTFAFDRSPPALHRADLARVQAAGLDLLSLSWKKFPDGSAGFPFRIDLPGGAFGDYAMQMGFIGQDLPGAYELIRSGLRRGDSARVAKGEAMVDFWAGRSLGKAGLPRTWYDANIGFRTYQTFLRIASDGMLGALRAWRAMRDAGRPRPAWLAYAQGFGAWLVSHQNPDGSFYRQYDYDTGAALDASKTNTLHPVPFLVELYRATGDARFRDAALKAGEYAWTASHLGYRYVGGTPDNPDVRDKEAGVLALDAFLALRDASGDAKWLAAARQAGSYAETWTYAWPVPQVEGDDSAEYRDGRDQTGLSLIALGHSGADPLMAYCPFAFFRLYAETGETHWLEFARFALHNTKQGMDWDPAHPLGYKYPGLQTEVGTVCAPRGHSIRQWLPWVTVDGLIPLSQLEDAFGSMDVDALAGLGAAALKARDSLYGAGRGYIPASVRTSRNMRVNPGEAPVGGVDALGRVRAHLRALRLFPPD